MSTQPNPQPADPSALATTLNGRITGWRKAQLLYVAAKLGIAALLAILSTAPTAPWGKGLDNAGVPCGLINPYGQRSDDPPGQHW